MITNNKRAWNAYAARYFKQTNFSYEVVDYGDPRCDTDETLHLLPDLSGKTVLELGCGGGNVGIALAKRGAQVIGVDLSNAQLQIAKQKAEEQGVTVRYIESDIETFAFSSVAPVDLVISVCALQYVSDLPRVFTQIHATLAPSGVFVFSTDDPIFYSVAAKFLWNEPGLQPTYFYSGSETWQWEEGDEYSFTTYRHPIDFYINTLTRVGFSIDRFHELPIHHSEIITEEERLEQLYPRLMVFKCCKRV
jgi:SAM-dependent methyltransferase